MKSIIKNLAILLVLNIFLAIFPKQVSAQQTQISFQVFYDQLSPYGQWMDYPKYGYVWLPDASLNMIPYSTRGYWIMTDYGWTWVSDYSWGWAPFHYGRWDYDNFYGWLWVPDTEWGPSWVTWRHSEGYYGWAPMQPGVSINVSFGRDYHGHSEHWMFVRDKDIGRPDINRFYISQNSQDKILKTSTVINKTSNDNLRHATYISGPAREDVQKVTGKRINSVAIQENAKPGQNMNNGQLRLFRPQVNRNNDKGQKSAPLKLANTKSNKPSPNKITTTQPVNTKKESNQKASNQLNSNKNTQSTQNNKINSAENNKSQQQQNFVKPVNNNAKVQTIQPRNNESRETSKKEQQQKILTPTNNENKVQQTQRSNSFDNNKKQQKTNTVQPKNNDNNSNKPQPNQTHNVTPPNNRQEQHPNIVKPQENQRNEQPKESAPKQDNKRRD